MGATAGLNDNTLGGLWADRLRAARPARISVTDCNGNTYDMPLARCYTKLRALINNSVLHDVTGLDSEGSVVLHQTFKPKAVTTGAAPAGPAVVVQNVQPTQGAAPAGPAAGPAASRATGPGASWTRPMVVGELAPWADTLGAVSELQLRVSELQTHNTNTALAPVVKAYEVAIEALNTTVTMQQGTIRELARMNTALRHELLQRPFVTVQGQGDDDDDESIGAKAGRALGQVAAGMLESIGEVAEAKQTKN